MQQKYPKGVDSPADSWHSDYELSLKLYTGACEAAYLNGHFCNDGNVF